MRVVIPDGKDDARDHSGRQGRCAWLFRTARTMRVVVPDGKNDARGYSGRQEQSTPAEAVHPPLLIKSGGFRVDLMEWSSGWSPPRKQGGFKARDPPWFIVGIGIIVPLHSL